MKTEVPAIRSIECISNIVFLLVIGALDVKKNALRYEIKNFLENLVTQKRGYPFMSDPWQTIKHPLLKTFFMMLMAGIFFSHDGVAQNLKPKDLEKNPQIAWTFKTHGPLFSSPVVSDGVVYFGGMDSTLYALDLVKGTLHWKFKTNGSIRSTVVIQENKLYLAGGNGVLSCIDKLTGKPVWRAVFDPTAIFLGERSYDFADYYHSSPVVFEDLVILGTGSGRMIAFSNSMGEEQWSFNAGDIVHNTPVIQDRKVFFGCFDGHVYALHARDGSLVWKFKTIGHQYFPKGEVQGSAATGFRNIFIGARDYNFYALDVMRGTANWNIKFNGGWALSASLQDSVVYIGTSDDRAMVAVDALTGSELWRTDVKYNVFGECGFSQSMVYVPTIWGKIYGIDKRTGRIKWGFATNSHTVNKGKYFKADESFRDDIATILRSPPEWISAEYKMGGIFSTPAVTDQFIVFTATDGFVYALKKG